MRSRAAHVRLTRWAEPEMMKISSPLREEANSCGVASTSFARESVFTGRLTLGAETI